MYEFLTTPLFWFLLVVFFMLIEVTHWGFICFFFGIGAFITGITTWTGLTNSLVVQLVVFIAMSLIFLFLLRKKMSTIFKGKISGKGQSVDNIRGERVIVVSPIHPGNPGGKVEFHGTLWEAQADIEIAKDTIVEIVERVNLTLKVKPILK